VNNRWSWLALGVGAYLAFALAAFPAGTAVRWFAPAGVTLSGIRGTLWSGVAVGGTATRGAFSGFTLEELRWRLRLWPLLLGRVSASFEGRLADGFVSADVDMSSRGIEFTNLRGGGPLAALGGLLPIPVRGQASVQLSSLVVTNGWPSRVVGELKLAGLEVPPLIPGGPTSFLPLGDYTVTFADATEGSLAARFVDDRGPLETSGTVTISPAREYALDAMIKPRGGAPEQLVEGLKFMTADPDAEGRRRLTLTGSL
jgi:Type II secretion system (T2SS), protein N